MSWTFNRLSKFLGRFTQRRGLGDPVSAVELHEPPCLAGPSAVSPLAISGHQLLRFIGKGAYGEVWLARDEIGVFHAVKIIHKSTFSDRSPFEREYRGILQYTPISRTHDALVHILHVGRNNDAGFFFYVMEVADCAHSGRNITAETYCARTLAYDLDLRGRLSVRECLIVGIDLTEGLRYLHSKQLVHRDIKPANIIFVNGIAKLADAGLVTHFAEAKRDAKDLGTEGFVPPEGPGTPWADVYSLGKVLSEASGGGADVQATVLSSLDEKEQDALLRLNQILFKACHEELNSRYQTVDELQSDLMQLHDQLYGGFQEDSPQC
jgi:serine/threonine protein kinase